jgi:hypothetical protein
LIDCSASAIDAMLRQQSTQLPSAVNWIIFIGLKPRAGNALCSELEAVGHLEAEPFRSMLEKEERGDAWPSFIFAGLRCLS